MLEILWKVLVATIVFGVFSYTLYLFIEPVKVIGDSMYPTYKDGDVLFISKKFYRLTLNQIYVYKSPKSNRDVLKRLVSMRTLINKKYLYFLGDNAEVSIDSRNYGYVEETNVVGKVIFHVRSKNYTKNRRKNND